MVLEQKQTKNEFSIERFESLMLSAGMTWKDINEELGYDAESMLKNKKKPPMNNIICKACYVIGLDNKDYVMMNTNNAPKLKIKPDTNIIYSNSIDIEKLNLIIEESDWDYTSLSTITSSNRVLYDIRKRYNKKIQSNDFNNICWALVCKQSNISNNNDIAVHMDIIPKNRYINKRQKYILNPTIINSLSKDMDQICKIAHIPTWFIYSDDEVHISLEMVNILCDAIKQVTNKNITINELCINGIARINKETERPTIEDICTAIVSKINYTITSYPLYTKTKGPHVVFEDNDSYYIRMQDMSNMLKQSKINSTQATIIDILVENSITTLFKQGGRMTSSLQFKGCDRSRRIRINKQKLIELSRIKENDMKPYYEVEESFMAVEKPEETINNDTLAEKFNTYIKENNDSKHKKVDNLKREIMKDLFDKIDNMTDKELDKLEEYIIASKKLREIKNNLLE